MKWTPIVGNFEIVSDEQVVFHGRTVKYQDPATKEIRDDGADFGVIICNEPFSDGTIRVTVSVDNPERVVAGICLESDLGRGRQVVATLGSITGYLFAISEYDEGRKEQGWRDLGGMGAGLRQSITPNTDYELEVRVSGQRVSLRVNGALILDRLLSQALQGNPIGLYGFAKGGVHFKNFSVFPRRPRAFVVMQFSTPYNELYTEVIKPVCASEGVEAIRVDESFTNGLIISEINQMIDQSSLIIAEITPANPNVYYEVGYAHALGKPTILVAERGCKLPFDLSPFRVLMYENSIDGKTRVEKGLRSHLQAIFKSGLD